MKRKCEKHPRSWNKQKEIEYERSIWSVNMKEVSGV